MARCRARRCCNCAERRRRPPDGQLGRTSRCRCRCAERLVVPRRRAAAGRGGRRSSPRVGQRRRERVCGKLAATGLEARGIYRELPLAARHGLLIWANRRLRRQVRSTTFSLLRAHGPRLREQAGNKHLRNLAVSSDAARSANCGHGTGRNSAKPAPGELTSRRSPVRAGHRHFRIGPANRHVQRRKGAIRALRAVEPGWLFPDGTCRTRQSIMLRIL